MDFGSVLKTLRHRSDMTQKCLADVLGVSESTIGMYERGKREPDFEMLEMIADYFNVDMDYLTGRSSVERRVSYSPSLRSDERQLLGYYNALNEDGKAVVMQVALATTYTHSEKNNAADLPAAN